MNDAELLRALHEKVDRLSEALARVETKLEEDGVMRRLDTLEKRVDGMRLSFARAGALLSLASGVSASLAVAAAKLLAR